jgi:osmoprotectant transport system permease protein
MKLFTDAISWLTDSSHYEGDNSIQSRVFEHFWISIVVLVIASALAVPIGFLVGHTGRFRTAAVVLAGGVRALPTLGLVSIIALSLGIGLRAPLIALVVLAVPSILTGAYAGFEAIDRSTIDAARAIGMTEFQIARHVEIPLGFMLLIGGLRSASLQVVATATLADYVGGGGLGRFIFAGLKTNDYPQMLAGAILVVALALASEAAFGIVQRLAQLPGINSARGDSEPARSISAP